MVWSTEAIMQRDGDDREDQQAPARVVVRDLHAGRVGVRNLFSHCWLTLHCLPAGN